MVFSLRPLPYDQGALDPYLSPETLQYHHGKHQQAYVNQLNKLIASTPWEDATLETLLVQAPEQIANQAAQVWNHEFYWHCLTPHYGQKPSPRMEAALKPAFESAAHFKKIFFEQALSLFGSGWVWLVETPTGGLQIRSSANAGTPLQKQEKPLLGVDVWEHAYYIDYRNQRLVYLEAIWQCLHWTFIEERLTQPAWHSQA